MNIFKRIKSAIFDNDNNDHTFYEEIITSLNIVKTLPNIDAGLERMRTYTEFNVFYTNLLTVDERKCNDLWHWLYLVHDIDAFFEWDKYEETQLAWIDWMIEHWQKELDNHLKTR